MRRSPGLGLSFSTSDTGAGAAVEAPLDDGADAGAEDLAVALSATNVASAPTTALQVMAATDLPDKAEEEEEAEEEGEEEEKDDDIVELGCEST